MDRKFLILIIILLNTLVIFKFHSTQVYQNYILIYGEGPIGQHPLGFEVRTYSLEDGVKIATDEILFFLAGMIYGYEFTYKIENPINNRKGFFELTPIVKLTHKDKNLNLREHEQSQEKITLQAIYRIDKNQRHYLRGFQSSFADTSQGEVRELFSSDWNDRMEAFELSIKNAILNAARKKYKSRPQYVTGRVLLAETPKFYIKSGQWRVLTKIHYRFTDVKYRESF